MKMGRAGAPFEPRRRPQAGKSGDPRSQNADSSPRIQGAPRLGRAVRRKGMSEAPRALTACGLGRHMAVDWTWVSPLPMTPRQLHGLDKSLHAKRVMITCDRGGRRLALAGYKYGAARALPVHPPLLLLLLHGSIEEVLGRREGKARQVEPASPPPKRGRGRPRKHPVATTAVPRGRGDDFQHGDGRTAAAGGRASVARSPRPRFRAAEVLP